MAHNPGGGYPPPPMMPVQGGGAPMPPPYGAPPPPSRPPMYAQPPPPPQQYQQQPPTPPHVMVGVPVAVPPGQPVIIGYERRVADDSCFSCDLSGVGIAATIFLLLFFFPLAWLPCVMESCRNRVSVPVYGQPGGRR
jgi:hypothetical protein